MNFFRQPFVYLTPCLILGILLGTLDSVLIGVSIFVLFLSVLFWLIKERGRVREITQLSIVSAGCFSLGVLLFKMNSNEGSSLVELSEGKKFSALVTVDELDDSEKTWRKGLVTINSIVGEDKLFPRDEQLLIYFNSSTIREKDNLLVKISADLIENRNNPGEFDVKSYWNHKNIYGMAFIGSQDYVILTSADVPFYERWRSGVEHWLHEALIDHLNGDQLAIAKALILGDKSLLSPELKKSFSSAGAMHVLAVSGLHVGIIVELLIFLLGRFPRIISKKQAMLVTLGIIWIYIAVIGFPASVVRAGFMFSFLVVGRLIGRSASSLNMLLLSGFIMLVINPLWIFDVGFQLSYLAMLGILLYYRPIASLFHIQNKWLRKIWEGTSVGLAAQLFTLPFTLYYFHQFPNYFLFTNLGMMVFAGLILGLGLLLFSTGWIPAVGPFVGVLLGICLMAMLFFVEFIESLPWSVARGYAFPVAVVLIGYAILLLFKLEFFSKWRRTVLIAGSIGLIIFVQFERFQAMEKSEVLVFNSNQVVIAMKSEDQLICLFDAPERKMKSIRYLMEGYQNLYPGKLKYVRIKKGKTIVHFGNKTLIADKTKNGVIIKNEASEEAYFIRTRFSEVSMKKEKVLDMPYHGNTGMYVPLCEGAFRFDL